ncbi:phosphoribosylglycinamide formyltransferase [Labrys miyagiensis]|jgi:phosphoribosylglycinamide formyltransferase 1|uniref:Phosphoribosylglycinamide formyltransferase n=1 Tax=Labrys miyagiensis TaxID=346912 RepID=A0ABQ6CMS3_9HYPH|nr:phosphoribosylglycinamide formyltransferase [Labrys miyagiensis]GLS21429.1 phosphoribosylglycinamide formyltransferase [Labrys miyagiensis]
MKGRKRVAILISGRGSNMAALIEAAKDPSYPAEIVAVISNRPGAPGLTRAREAGLVAEAIDHKAFASRSDFEAALEARLEAHVVDLVVLAGFMRLMTAAFVESWAGRMINIHPALLPAFPGLATHERALEAGVRLHGCTVHYVTPGMDEGPIIAQAAVPVLAGDTAAELGARVLRAEHKLYPAALARVARGEAPIVGERVEIASGDLLMNP